MAKKQIEDSAENLGKEVGGYFFKQAFGALADAITDVFTSSEEEESEEEEEADKTPRPPVRKKVGKRK